MTTTTANGDAATELYRQANNRFAAGDYRQASTLLDRAIELGPRRSGIRMARAMCDVKTGDLDAGERGLRVALTIDHANIAARLELARVLAKLGRTAEATAEYDTLLASKPGHPSARVERDRLRPPSEGSALTDLLDSSKDALLDQDMKGRPIQTGCRRSLLSHRRLWFGVALLIAAVADLAVQPQPAVRTVGQFLAPALHGLAVPVAVAGTLLIVAAVISAAVTRYDIYARRIDVTSGVLLRSRRIIWMYDLLDAPFQQDLALQLLGTGRIVLITEKFQQTMPGVSLAGAIAKLWIRHPVIVGTGTTAAMKDLQDELFRRALLQRRAAKKNFI